MKVNFRKFTVLIFAPLLVSGTNVLGKGSVWLPAPGAASITVSRVSQSADDFWHIVDGKMEHTAFPPGLEQTATFINGSYGISDAFALDAEIGWSEASNTKASVHPTLDGRTDLNVGLTWRIVDEVTSDSPSIAVRAGAILAGDYEVNYPTAIGLGANGFELSGVVGKIFDDRFALSAELGTRNRADDIPRETFVNLDAHVIVGSNLVFSAQYHIQRSDGDADIHGPGFTRFVLPFVAEDIDRVGIGGTFSVGDIDVGIQWFNVVDGRNTADFDAVAATFSYNFEL